jgi:uncharacterized membrane protein YkoI
MNRRTVIALVGLLLSSQAGLAHTPLPEWDAPVSAFASGGISLDQAVQMAQARFHARVVRAETANEGNRVVYLLRLLSADGRVFSVRVDAQTGQFN